MIPILDLAQWPSVHHHMERRRELTAALELAQLDVVRITTERAESQQRLRRMTSGTQDASDLPAEQEQLAQLDQALTEAHHKLENLQQLCKEHEALSADTIKRASAERKDEAAQRASAVAAEMLQIFEWLVALNRDLLAYCQIAGYSARAPLPLDEKILGALAKQLGGPLPRPARTDAA